MKRPKPKKGTKIFIGNNGRKLRSRMHKGVQRTKFRLPRKYKKWWNKQIKMQCQAKEYRLKLIYGNDWWIHLCDK